MVKENECQSLSEEKEKRKRTRVNEREGEKEKRSGMAPTSKSVDMPRTVSYGYQRSL